MDEVVAGEGAGSEADNAPASAGVAAVAAIAALIAVDGCGGVFVGVVVDGPGGGDRRADEENTDLYLDAEGIAGKVPLWPPELNRCPRGRGTPAAEEDEPPAGGGGSTEVVE
ncbi:hypothetical protein LTR60_006258 [Cryomyces antarcticus]|nr:hypothetical protein LTR60_006258 [Cryomyces antarcticus]